MSKVFVGKGDSTGMAFRAPAGTALPSYPGASLSADWVACGNVGEDGIGMTLPSGEVIRNWALDPERKNNVHRAGDAIQPSHPPSSPSPPAPNPSQHQSFPMSQLFA